MRDTIVLGERCGDVADELLGLDISFHSDMTATVSGHMQVNGPLWRALGGGSVRVTDAGPAPRRCIRPGS